MLTTVGMLEPPLGNMRLQVVKLISALLVRSSSSIEQEVVVLGMFNTLIVSTGLHCGIYTCSDAYVLMA